MNINNTEVLFAKGTKSSVFVCSYFLFKHVLNKFVFFVIGIEKTSTLDQSTSITGLHLFGTTLKVDDVPQDFLTSLMSKSMSAIPYKFYRQVCIKLDTLRRLYWDDFRLLGEKVGLSKDEIAWLEQTGHPTKTIIEKFDSQKNSCIGKFKAILEEMERSDVSIIIDEWVVDEWFKFNTSNNSPSKLLLRDIS